MGKLTRSDLEKSAGTVPQKSSYIKVGLSSCGIAAGAQEVFDLLTQEVAKRNLPITVGRCGCSGMCYAEPLVEVFVEGLPTVVYGKVTCDIANRILEEHVHDLRLVNDHIVDLTTRSL
jgi:(2Fe-2S) ferredoxin